MIEPKVSTSPNLYAELAAAGSCVVVTGAAGFIASHLVHALVQRGVRVVGIDNFDRFYPREDKLRNWREATEGSHHQRWRNARPLLSHQAPRRLSPCRQSRRAPEHCRPSWILARQRDGNSSHPERSKSLGVLPRCGRKQQQRVWQRKRERRIS
jgi:hypothetical protein